MMKVWIWVVITSMLLASCGKAAPRPGWTWVYADLRALDDVDTLTDGADILALYLRQSAGDLRLRLDFLDIDPEPNYDIYLAIDNQPGGINQVPVGTAARFDWDVLISVPARGAPQAVNSQHQPLAKAGVNIMRNPELDSVDIRLDNGLTTKTVLGFGGGTRVQVWITLPGGEQPVDILEPVQISGSPPPQMRILLAFWNTLPAATPAQALRRWDGAHTGSTGGRHGLHNLLSAAREYHVPVVLLDLLHPTSVTLLEALGGLEELREAARQGLIILPNPLPGLPGMAPLPNWAVERVVDENRQVAASFNLPNPATSFQPLLQDQVQGSRIAFTALAEKAITDTVTIYRAGGNLIVPIPGYLDPQLNFQPVNKDGPGLELRQALGKAAIRAIQQPDHPPVLIVGGDLPATEWGDPEVASFTFRYLQARPWIKIMASADLLTVDAAPITRESTDKVTLGTTGPGAPTGRGSEPPDWLLRALREAPDNRFGDAAWQAFRSFYAPAWPASEELYALRQNYLGYAGFLLEAAQWAEAPHPQASCEVDADKDGDRECILANQTIFALFEPGNASLPVLVWRGSDGSLHQAFSPSYQFISGASDPYSWDLAAGLYADPEVIQGAFASRPTAREGNDQQRLGSTPLESDANSSDTFQVQIENNLIRFEKPGRAFTKIFRLQEDGFEVEYQGNGLFALSIPLAVDPWERFIPGWTERYYRYETPQDYTWGVETDEGQIFWVRLRATVGLSTLTFQDSAGYLLGPEDPNFDYPDGHFLPYPMALANLEAENGFRLQIELGENLNQP